VIRELFPALVLMEQADPEATPFKTLAECRLDRLGDYRLFREVGRGGMEIVYEAEQEALGRHVALKVLPVSTATDARSLARFRREARSAARLHHTNIVPVFDVGEREGVHYYAMQFIQGQGLDEVIVELRSLRRRGTAPAASVEGGPAGGALSGQAVALAEGLRSGEFGCGGLIGGSPKSRDGRASQEAPDRNKPSVLTDQSDLSARSDFQFYRSVARIGLQAAEALA
jgi:eukaryotic-like serine/threonine-protein kinase